MFRSKDQPQEPQPKDKPFRGSTPGPSKPPTLIADGAHVNGEIKVKGAAVIEGTVEGSIVAEGDVQIGSRGRVTAEIEAKNITVAGSVKGKVYADDKVELKAGSRVEGDIHSQSLKIEDTAFFHGGCVMGEGARKRRADEQVPLPESIKKAG